MAGLSVTQLAWAAGFLEGEGSFSTHHGTPRVSAGQVQRDPLDKLIAMFGGHIWLKHPKPCTKIQSKQPIWIWTLDKRRSAGVMMTLYSFMSPKRRDQIEAAIAQWKAARNVRDAGAKVCLRGHSIDGYNALSIPNRTHPVCRICKNEVRKEWRHRTGKK